MLSLIGVAALALQAPSTVDAQRACQAIEDDGQRLACYDAAARRAVVQEEVAKEVRAQEAKETFGTQSESVGAREIERVTSSISAIKRLGNGTDIVTLANGQVWRTTEAGNLNGRLRRGMDVEIERGQLGGFQISTAVRSGWRGVRRID